MAKANQNICIVTTVSTSVKAFYQGQIEALNQAGFQTTVICGEDPALKEFLPKETRYIPVSFSRVISPWRDFCTLLELIRIFKREKYKIVQYSTPKASLLGSVASFIAGVPCRVYILWGLYYIGQQGFKRNLFKGFEKIVCLLSHQVLPIAHEMVDFVEKEGITHRKKCRVMLNGSACGVDLKRFNPNSYLGARKEIRNQYKIPKDAVVIGTVARLTGDKGINELVMAFRDISRENANVYLLLVGQQEEKDRLQPEVEEIIFQHASIRCAGWQDNPIPFYQAMDIFCLPTYREGFGEVNLEAQAMGLPVISTDVIGPRESVEDGVTGILVPSRNIQALKEALLKLIQDDTRRRQMGIQGCIRVREMFNREVLIKAIVQHRLSLLDALTCKQEG